MDLIVFSKGSSFYFYIIYFQNFPTLRLVFKCFYSFKEPRKMNAVEMQNNLTPLFTFTETGFLLQQF